MCGIIGLIGKDKGKNPVGLETVKKALDSMKYRGVDGLKIQSLSDSVIFGHALHSVVNKVEQPLMFEDANHKFSLIANCEIYNWEELCKEHKIAAQNDAVLLFRLLIKNHAEKDLIEILRSLDGPFAFAFYSLEKKTKREKIILARDLLGIKPLFYSHSDSFAFSSEKKALLEMVDANNSAIIELNPRQILIYDITDNKSELVEKEFFKTMPETKDQKKRIIARLTELFTDAVKKRIPDKKFGLLFSGGIDSCFIALMLKNLGCDFVCYTAAFEDPNMKESEDLIYAKKAAKLLDLKLKVITIKEDRIESYLKKIIPLIEDTNVTKVGVALPFFVACEQAKKDGCKVIFSGLGSEEIFAGYERHKKSQDINKECLSGLIKIYERDLYRDDVITMFNNIELRLPFLDAALIEYALRIPEKHKINDETNKMILRETALTNGLPEEFALRKKRAAQYGSNFHKALERLARKNKNKLISDYLRQFYPMANLRLGALISSGKDSLFAMFTMLKQNYAVPCIITLKSKNKDSFMFHTPAIDMVKLQAQAMDVPLIEQDTAGKKESELNDLKIALRTAKERYKLDGIITGALFSNYQRERIEKVADSLGLKIFSPLWHIDQETEIREIINQGFKFILVRVAADGFDRSWLGHAIEQEDVDRLVELNKKNGINIAGEGGEFESLVLDCPMFNEKIIIDDFDIVCEKKYDCVLTVKKAHCEKKL